MDKWLSRFSFSFFIVAAVLAWNVYKLVSAPTPGPTSRIALNCAGAGACLALGVAGVRARHAASPDPPPRDDDQDGK
jgi:uncharacterized membrane protein YcfT